jgi:protein Mpv17
VLFDAAYRGGFQHAAFPWIIEHCRGDVLGRLVTSSVVDPALLAAVECTAFNQLLVVPIVYYPLFFGITGAVQGLSLTESLARARAQWSARPGTLRLGRPPGTSHWEVRMPG